MDYGLGNIIARSPYIPHILSTYGRVYLAMFGNDFICGFEGEYGIKVSMLSPKKPVCMPKTPSDTLQ